MTAEDLETRNRRRVVPVRRQVEDSSGISTNHGPTVASAQTSALVSESSARRTLPAAAIAGIVLVGVITIGLVILIWRWWSRMKRMEDMSNREFHPSLQKYGVGKGVGSVDSSTNSAGSTGMHKMEIQGSFFEADEFDTPPAKSKRRSVTFEAQNDRGPKNSAKEMQHSSWFYQVNKVSESSRTSSGKFKSISDGKPSGYTGRSRTFSVQTLPENLRAKNISAPLQVIRPPEPWSPEVSSTPTNPRQYARLRSPKLPPPVAFNPQKLKHANVPGDQVLQVRLPPIDPSADGSLYSRNSLCSEVGEHPSSPPANLNPLPSPPRRASIQVSLPTSGFGGVFGFEYEPPGSSGSGSGSGGNRSRWMTAISSYAPKLDDELHIQVGDTVRVIEEYKDSWCLVQHVGKMDSPKGVVPSVCLQERRRIVPLVAANGSGLGTKLSNSSLSSAYRR